MQGVEELENGWYIVPRPHAELKERRNARSDYNRANWPPRAPGGASLIKTTKAQKEFMLNKSDLEPLKFLIGSISVNRVHVNTYSYFKAACAYRAWEKYGGPAGFAEAKKLKLEKKDARFARQLQRDDESNNDDGGSNDINSLPMASKSSKVKNKKASALQASPARSPAKATTAGPSTPSRARRRVSGDTISELVYVTDDNAPTPPSSVLSTPVSSQKRDNASGSAPEVIIIDLSSDEEDRDEFGIKRERNNLPPETNLSPKVLGKKRAVIMEVIEISDID